MFQSAHPHGVRSPGHRRPVCRPPGFNPRTRMGCDCMRDTYLEKSRFQSAHPHGVRSTARLSSSLSVRFQSAHPHGVRFITFHCINQLTCFNPRTRMGCDSILRGAADFYKSFNPRTRMGCDNVSEEPGCKRREVSIRAPAWGAILRSWLRKRIILKFQSAHPHGVRLGFKKEKLPASEVSIRAPAWGAICLSRFIALINLLVSIRAPAWGAIKDERFNCVTKVVSIRAPAWGAMRR